MQPNESARTSGWSLPVAVLGIAAACAMYRILVLKRLEQSSLLFIGIPTMLALIISLSPKAKTATGGILKVTSLFLLLSGPLLGEGFICIVMAAPIFLGVALVIGLVVDGLRARKKGPVLHCLVLATAFLPMSLEGANPWLSFNREETVRVSRIVAGTPDEVAKALTHSTRTDLPIPLFFRMGFPQPTESHGEGLNPGDMRTIHFAGGEGHPGDVVLTVTTSAAGHATFTVVSDKSKIAHWLDWKSAEVNWYEVSPGHTQVEWTLHYRRLLDPAWYFRPWERYAVTAAAEYLIRANATPTEPK